MDPYGADLAYIHDQGFGGFARAAAPGVLALLKQAGIASGRVVDLGCGSGIWARSLLDAGYDVLGVDLSPGMLDLAGRRAPEAHFIKGSLLAVDLPPCAAVTALGECVNYLFDGAAPAEGEAALARLFARVYHALAPGGLFVFDAAEPGQEPPGRPRRGWWEGEGWAICVDVQEDSEARVLTRRIVTFRGQEDLYRRHEEVHLQRLYPREVLLALLRAAGFKVRTSRSYGEAPLARAHTAYCARKR